MTDKDQQIEWLKKHLQLELQDIQAFLNRYGKSKSYKGQLIATQYRLKYVLDNLILWEEKGILPDEINA